MTELNWVENPRDRRMIEAEFGSGHLVITPDKSGTGFFLSSRGADGRWKLLSSSRFSQKLKGLAESEDFLARSGFRFD